MALKSLPAVTVTGANTATKLAATRTPCHMFAIQCTQASWLGDSNVNSTPASERGLPLAINTTQQIVDEMAANDLDLSQIYFSSTNAAAKAYVIYIEG